MKKYLTTLIVFFLANLAISQNVGIGIVNPTRARLEQFSGSTLNLSNVIFGSSNAGISIQQNPPALGFNQYLDNGSSYSPRWMANGYGLKQQLDVSTGIMTWKFLRTGIAENIIVPADEKIGMQLNYNAINGSTGLGVNRAPLTSFHVLYKDPNFGGTGAGFSPYGMAGFESNIDAFINVMSPVGFQNGLLMGSPTNAIRGGVIYSHASNIANESLALRTGGNLNRIVISAAGNVAIGDFVASNKLDIDGGVSVMGINVDISSLTPYYTNGNDRYYAINSSNRSYVRIVNAAASCCQWISQISPGTKAGQIMMIEVASDFAGFNGASTATINSNLNFVTTVSYFGPPLNYIVSFIWNGTEWVNFSRL